MPRALHAPRVLAMPMTLHQWVAGAEEVQEGLSSLEDIVWDTWATPHEVRDRHWTWGTAVPRIIDMIPRVSRLEDHVSLSNKLRWFCFARKFGVRWLINTKIRRRARLGVLMLLQLRVLPRADELFEHSATYANALAQFLVPNDLPREWRRLHVAATRSPRDWQPEPPVVHTDPWVGGLSRSLYP